MARFPDFAAAEVVTDTKMDQLSVDFILKNADESVTSSTVLQNDDALLATIGATGTYAFDLYLFASSAANAAGDLSVGFTFPTGTMYFGASGPSVNLASGSQDVAEWIQRLSAVSGTTTVNFGLSTTITRSHIHGLFIATATGTLQTQWAQFASNANASTVKAGSHLILRRVA